MGNKKRSLNYRAMSQTSVLIFSRKSLDKMVAQLENNKLIAQGKNRFHSNRYCLLISLMMCMQIAMCIPETIRYGRP